MFCHGFGPQPGGLDGFSIMTKVNSTYVAGAALVALAAVCWSLGGLLARLIEEASAFHVMAYRALFSLPMLAGFLFWRHGWAAPQRVWAAGASGLLGGAGLSLAFIGYILAIMNTSVANALFILSAGPVFAAIFNRLFLREAISPATWIAIGCAILGVSVMVLSGIEGGGLFGNLMALCSTLGFAFYTIVLRRSAMRAQNIDMMAAPFIGACITIVFGFVMAGGFALTTNDLVACAILGLVQIGLPAFLYNAGAARLPAAQSVLIAQLEILLGTLWVWLFLSEAPAWATLAGGALVLSAVVGQTVWNARYPIGGLEKSEPPRQSPRRHVPS